LALGPWNVEDRSGQAGGEGGPEQSDRRDGPAPERVGPDHVGARAGRVVGRFGVRIRGHDGDFRPSRDDRTLLLPIGMLIPGAGRRPPGVGRERTVGRERPA